MNYFVRTPADLNWGQMDRFGVMLLLAAGIAVLASLLGVYLSFFLDSAPT